MGSKRRRRQHTIKREETSENPPKNEPANKAEDDLDQRLEKLFRTYLDAQQNWQEKELKLFEYEESFLQETILEGNALAGFGDIKTAAKRMRNASIRRKKRERMLLQNPEEPLDDSKPLTEEEQLRIDQSRIASYTSVTSPAEPLRATLAQREKALAVRQQQEVMAPPVTKQLKTSTSSKATKKKQTSQRDGSSAAAAIRV